MARATTASSLPKSSVHTIGRAGTSHTALFNKATLRAQRQNFCVKLLQSSWSQLNLSLEFLASKFVVWYPKPVSSTAWLG